MDIQEHLESFSAKTGDVSLVAYGDLSSGLILKWSAKTACQRETLDLLGEKAHASFGMIDSVALPEGAVRSDLQTSVIHFTEGGQFIFARSPDDPEDVICAVCTPGAPLEPLLVAVSELADKIAGPT